MNWNSTKKAIDRGLLCVGLFAALGHPTACRAGLVSAGFDHFRTVDPTLFMGIPFQGVPFDGDGTDTIVQRFLDVGVSTPPGGMGVTPIEIVALQLMSKAPVDLSAFGGSGFHFLFVTLQTVQTPGTMAITFNGSDTGGTFSSSLPVAFDIRSDSLTGLIIFSDMHTLTSQNVPWAHTPGTGAFRPSMFTEAAGALITHTVTPIPEPTTLIPGMSAVVTLLGVVWTRSAGSRLGLGLNGLKGTSLFFTAI